MQNTHPISLSRLTFGWPDGTPVFTDVSAVFAAGRTGLVGPNGTGKTALLRLITGELAPGSGTLMTSSNVNYLPQKLTLRTEQTVTGLLGMAEKRRALADVLAGRESNMAENLELIGDDWDLEERAVALLSGYGLPADGPDFLDRTVGTLSGGEAMITALAGLELTARPITLLDEPTNNLDRTARERLYQAVERWRGTLVIATHDRALLERVDAIAELRPVRSRAWSGERVELIRHGGNWSVYEAELAAERETAERAVRDAGARLATEKRQRIEAETKIARRAKAGRKAADSMPKILANELRKKAEQSAGKVRGTMGSRESDAAAALADARDAVRAETRIRIDLPDTAVPPGRTVLDAPARVVDLGELHDGRAPLAPDARLTLRGPERVALTGPNGVGKTTLLNALVPLAAVPVGYLRQRIGFGSARTGEVWEGLDDSLSVLENVRAAAPSADPAEVREQLARFHFRGDLAHQPVRELSGGERFRVALARILLAQPAPQLLLLDEPTNNLDLVSTEQLVSALADYKGAMVVSSHDDAFLAALAPERHWELRRPAAGGEATAQR
ncbi:ABC-F family ATP-binding cassette domain-containing protein [Arthrobacter sp. N199823]|uniref:ABC-F family ATP-binding cassette domain-containing protein n=1 Tax=Arthrobacter sp. N199823 TaxID=2058895 RepID=UPI000CE428E2|nr:ABC-F family ATP-binding cassette domain-containing protein [Arthrobacter sp. N199823]